jgi:hypothetical protein
VQPVDADRYERDVIWRTCEPGPGQRNTAERGQHATWMDTQVTAGLLAGERDSCVSQREKLMARKRWAAATARRLQTGVRDPSPYSSTLSTRLGCVHTSNAGDGIIFRTWTMTNRIWSAVEPVWAADWTVHVNCPPVNPVYTPYTSGRDNT